ncbi:MAG: ACT domain-containing protein [Coriobacteriia bacterium]
MKVRQLSVFIENKAGRVSEVTDILGDKGVNIRGFSVSDTADYGILRLVVDRPDEAISALKEHNFTVKESDVLCIKLEDEPGALAKVLRMVSDSGVNIEYVYSLISTYVVINVSDAESAYQMLKDKPVQLVSHDELASL